MPLTWNEDRNRWIGDAGGSVSRITLARDLLADTPLKIVTASPTITVWDAATGHCLNDAIVIRRVADGYELQSALPLSVSVDIDD